MDSNIRKICDSSRFISVTHRSIVKLLMAHEYANFESNIKDLNDINLFCSKIADDTNNLNSQSCKCNYAICLNWYPCNYKNCKLLNNQEVQSCSISSCRSCYHFQYVSHGVMSCLWDI